MPENKTKPNNSSVEEFLKSRAGSGQFSDVMTLIEMCSKITGHPPVMWGTSIVGFDSYKYKYASGHSGESCLVGLSIRGREIVIYILGETPEQLEILSKLGKHKIGKSCLYFKRLADLDTELLYNLILGSVNEMRRRYPASHDA